MNAVSNGSVLQGDSNVTASGGGTYIFGDTFQKIILSISLIGMVDNLLVCFVIYRVKTLQTIANAFVFNQAVVDSLASFLIIVNHFVEPAGYRGLGGQLLCRFWKSRYLLWACFTASTYSLLALTFERYFAIVYPLRYIATFTAKKVRVVITVAWLSSFIIAMYALFLREVSPSGTCYRKSISKLTSTAVSVYVFSCQYLLPILFMSFAYSHIAFVLSRNINTHVMPPPSTNPATADTTPANTHGNSASHAQQGSLKNARKNVFKTFCLVFFAYVICWTPNQVYFMVFYVMNLFGTFSWKVHEVTVIMAYCNSCINPIIYAIKYRSFRAALRKAFFCQNSVNDTSGVMS